VSGCDIKVPVTDGYRYPGRPRPRPTQIWFSLAYSIRINQNKAAVQCTEACLQLSVTVNQQMWGGRVKGVPVLANAWSPLLKHWRYGLGTAWEGETSSPNCV